MKTNITGKVPKLPAISGFEHCALQYTSVLATLISATSMLMSVTQEQTISLGEFFRPVEISDLRILFAPFPAVDMYIFCILSGFSNSFQVWTHSNLSDRFLSTDGKCLSTQDTVPNYHCTCSYYACKPGVANRT